MLWHCANRRTVAFVAKGAVLGKAKPLLEEAWAPEALAIGSKAAYLWCARGMNLARRLGFIEVDKLWVLTRTAT
jgi:hypothetical protein